MEAKTVVQNGTNLNRNIQFGQMRFIENEGGLTIKYHMTECERLIGEFSAFAVKTAQSTVEMCRVVYEAKQSLETEEFIKFCSGIGHAREDSTIRKYLVIGQHYDRLIKYANLLPNSWTSIYTITQLSDDVFEAMAITGNSMVSMTGAQLKALVSPPSASSATPSASPSHSPTLTSGVTGSKSVASVAIPTPTDAVSGSSDKDDNGGTPTPVDSEAVRSAPPASNSTTGSAQSKYADLNAKECNVVGSDSPASTAPSETDNAVGIPTIGTAPSTPDKQGELATDASVGSDETFGIVLRFKSKPSHPALRDLVEWVLSFRKKHQLDLSVEPVDSRE